MCECTERSHSHVEVLLGHLQIPLDGAVDVEVKLLGHGQRNQRRSDCIGLLTEMIRIGQGLSFLATERQKK